MAYTWVRGTVLPQLLPWLALLGLLGLKRNREAHAWWIWVPVVCGFGLVALLRRYGSLLSSSQVLGFFAPVIVASSFGLAALWLIASALESKGRWVSFFLMLLIIGGVGGITMALSESDAEFDSGTFIVGFVLLMAMAAGLSLTGLVCRKAYRPLAVLGCTLASTVILTCLGIAPFVGYAAAVSTGPLEWNQILIVIGWLIGLSFSVLLPFLALSFLNRFYGERLRTLLHIKDEAPATIVASRPLEMGVRM